MAKSKVITKPRVGARSRKNARNEIAMPSEILQSTVFCIDQKARIKPINRLIGDTLSQTIEKCKSVIDWLAHIEQPFGDEELALAESHILHTVVDALAHAAEDAKSLWRAAKGMVEVPRG